MIEIKSLYKSFGSKKVLKNINLCFNPGEVVGIVGENGAGKTTLFNCLIGLEDYQGEINYSNKSLKNVTGFLSTDPFFLSKITGLEYLQLLCNARNIKHTSFKEKNIFDLPLNQYAETYSTGMKKKLALLGILLQQNEIFILDEPFNGVDIHNNILIQELIHKLKSLNKIVILSSHIFSTLEQTCDYLHYLKDGEIVKSVDKSGFADIEQQMKGKQLANIIDNIGLI